MVAKVPYLSLEKETENVGAVFTSSIERECEIFMSHVLEEKEHDVRVTWLFC